MLGNVIHIFPSAGLEVAYRRLEVVTWEMAVRRFGALWMLSWSWVDDLATTEVRVRHGRCSSLGQEKEVYGDRLCSGKVLGGQRCFAICSTDESGKADIDIFNPTQDRPDQGTELGTC